MVVAAALRTLWASRLPEPENMMSMRKRSTIGFFVGAFAGFIGGMLGLGGGFIIAPILMMMGYKTKEAAATTAFVVTFSSISRVSGSCFTGTYELVAYRHCGGCCHYWVTVRGSLFDSKSQIETGKINLCCCTDVDCS